MLPVELTKTMTALFGPGAPDTLAPARVDPAALALSDTDRSGTLSREEIRAALLADRIRFDVATDRLLPATPMSLASPPQPATKALTDAVTTEAVSETVTGETLAAHTVAETVAERVPATAAPALGQLTQQALRLAMAPSPEAAKPQNPMTAPWPRNEPLMLAPHLGSLPAATITSRGVDLTSPLTPKGTFRLGMHVDTDPTLAQRRGTMLLEESHPRYLAWSNVAGSGLNLGLDSRTRLEMAGLQPGQPMTGTDGATLGASVRHEQRLFLERSFSLFGRQPDSSLQAGYLVGVGPWQWPNTAPRALPLTQYATVSVKTQPHRYLGLSGEVYVPVQDGPTGRGAHPIGRISATVPYLTVGTTQSVETARYDASLTVKPAPYVHLAASGAVDQNRTTGTTGVTAGVQLSIPW